MRYIPLKMNFHFIICYFNMTIDSEVTRMLHILHYHPFHSATLQVSEYRYILPDLYNLLGYLCFL